jgi:hypothetical protein
VEVPSKKMEDKFIQSVLGYPLVFIYDRRIPHPPLTQFVRA